MYITVHPLLAAFPLQGGLVANNTRMLARRSPVTIQAAKDFAETLGDAANKRIDKLAPESKTKAMRIRYNTPGPKDLTLWTILEMLIIMHLMLAQ